MSLPPSQVLGRRAEDEAVSFFLSRGFSLVDRHWSCRSGELDLIIKRGSRLHFVEVKARASARQHPLEAISRGKIQRLVRALEAWLAAHPDHEAFSYQVDAFCLWRDRFSRWQSAWVEGISL